MLSAVSCAASDACTAVGTYTTSGGQASLAERWDGEGWFAQASADTGHPEELTGVSCPTSEECTAVGDYEPNGRWVAMVQTWNGVAWSAQAPELTKQMKQASELHAVSCAAGSTCAAVGITGWSAGGHSRSGSVGALAEIRSTTPSVGSSDPASGPALGPIAVTSTAPAPTPPLIATPPTPTISSLSETAKTWRERNAPAAVSLEEKSRKPPLGTTFSFSLNEPASVTFAFTELADGRKVGKSCMAQTERNRRKRRCTRTVIAATLTFSAHAGTNRVHFEGLITEHTRLEPGSYTLLVSATASGKRSIARTLQFTIAEG